MRISDWSSDVCSSDLDRLAENEEPGGSRDCHHPADDEHVAAGPGGYARHQQPASDHGLAVRTLFLHQWHGRISPPPLTLLPVGSVNFGGSLAEGKQQFPHGGTSGRGGRRSLGEFLRAAVT